MKRWQIMAIAFSALVLTGCATSVTMTGKSYPSVPPQDVKVLFKTKPDCGYEELAFISTPMQWNQNVAVDSAREAAANIGADFLMIETVHKNAYNDASVSAIAYKCGVVDREDVDVEPE